jgi:hypothetical protein
VAARNAKTKKPGNVRRPFASRAKAKSNTKSKAKTKPARKPAAKKPAAPRKRAPSVDPKVAVAIALALELDAAEQTTAPRSEAPSGWQLSGRARRTHTR